MIYKVSITSQGQISIPAKLRQKFGLKKAGKAIISEENGKITLEPVVDFLELGGSLKTNKRFSSKQIRAGFEEYLANQGIKDLK